MLMALRMGRAFDEGDRELARIALSVSKYWVSKRGPAFASEALEVLGGNGYIETQESPVAQFYRMSKNVSDPVIHSQDWSLRVHGLVGRELRITYTELLELPRQRHRANGETESRACDQQMRPQHQQQAGGEDHHAVDANTERTGFDGTAREQCRKRFWIAAVGHAKPDGLAQHGAGHQGREQHIDAGGAAQGDHKNPPDHDACERPGADRSRQIGEQGQRRGQRKESARKTGGSQG